MHKIQKVSSYLGLIFNGLIAAIPLVILSQWLFMGLKNEDVPGLINFWGMLEKTIQTPEGLSHLREVAWTPKLKLLGFSADILGNLPFLMSLFFLKSLFYNYKNGEIFTVRNALLYRNLGILYLVDALLITSLSQTLMILAVTLTNSPGHRYLSIGFGAPNLYSLFYGVLGILVSWVMMEASKIYDESKLTV